MISHSIFLSALVVLLAGVLPKATNGELTCPTGQTKYGNRCYKTYRPSPSCDHDFSFAQARDFCEDNGGQLATVNNQTKAEFLADLIEKDQRAKQKACRDACPEKESCNCQNANQDYLYWIGMQLTHSASGQVSGASWVDGSPVTYGNPLVQPFRPPFVPGHPIGSADDGLDDSEVCPEGNQNKCVQIYGYGSAIGRWKDQVCTNNHTIEHHCSCNITDSNSTIHHNHHHHHHHHLSSSSSEEDREVKVDKCRDEEALNGFICQYCPVGFTAFQGNCYKAVVGAKSPAAHHAACHALGEGVNVVSIHNSPENVFVANLATAAAPGSGSFLIGLNLVFPNQVFETPPTGASWSDGSPVNYANPLVVPRGQYPWAPQNGVYPAQPDNRPPPGNCVVVWIPPTGNPFGTWDDLDCTEITPPSTVCKV